MGRKSRAKRERREDGVGQIAAAAKGRTRHELLALVEAASASPASCHRIPSLELTLAALLNRTRFGSRPVSPSMLAGLVGAAREERPELAGFEDCVPCDPRMSVHVRWGNELFRLIPGVSTNTVATIDLWEWLAEAIDPVLVPAVGYGFGDVVEVALRRMSYVASELSPYWPGGDMPELDSLPRIRAPELDAAVSLRPLQDQITDCGDPVRARKAIMAHSTSPRHLRCEPCGHNPAFGDIIAIREGDGAFRSIPAAFLMGSVDGAAILLAGKALALNSGVLGVWRELVARKLAVFLFSVGHDVRGPLRLPSGDFVHSVSRYGPRQWVAVDVVAQLRGESVEDELAQSRTALSQVVPGAVLESRNGRVEVPDDAIVATAQVMANPQWALLLPVGRGSLPPISLPEVLRIVRSAEEPSDLWYYLVDRQDPDGPEVFRPSELGIWEGWRRNGKALHRSGRQFATLFVGDDGSEDEWADASSLFGIERSLLALGLPSARHWPTIDFRGETTWLGDLRNQTFCAVLAWDTPVAVSASWPPGGLSATDLLHDATAGIAHALRRTQSVAEEAFCASGIEALRIEFSHDPRPDAPPIACGGYLERAQIGVSWGSICRLF